MEKKVYLNEWWNRRTPEEKEKISGQPYPLCDETWKFIPIVQKEEIKRMWCKKFMEEIKKK